MDRDEFALALHMAMNPDREVHRARHADVVLAAWDAQAAEVERLRAEVEALRKPLLATVLPCGEPTGVPLTLENAPRAWVVALADGDVLVADGEGWWQWTRDACHDTTEYLLRVGATVLAWRKP